MNVLPNSILYRNGIGTLMGISPNNGATMWDWMVGGEPVQTVKGEVLFPGPWEKSLYCADAGGNLKWMTIYDIATPVRDLFLASDGLAGVLLSNKAISIIRIGDGQTVARLDTSCFVDDYPVRVLDTRNGVVCIGRNNLALYRSISSSAY